MCIWAIGVNGDVEYPVQKVFRYMTEGASYRLAVIPIILQEVGVSPTAKTSGREMRHSLKDWR
jgi:hypothetical protein